MSDIFNLLHTLAASRGTGDKPFRRRIRSEDKSHKATITLHKTPMSLTKGVLLEAALSGAGNIGIVTPAGELPTRELDGIDTAAALLGTNMPEQLRKELEAIQVAAELEAVDVETELVEAVRNRAKLEAAKLKEAEKEAEKTVDPVKPTAMEERANTPPVKPEPQKNGKPVPSGK